MDGKQGVGFWLLIGAIAVGAIYFTGLEQKAARAPTIPAASAAPRSQPSSNSTEAKTSDPPPAGSQWHYSEKTDVMSNNLSKSATVDSTNTFNFSFPYSGTQHAHLGLRRHPRLGAGVIFMIEQGQLQCGISGCPVNVRFDDGKVATYVGSKPADNSSEAVFLPGPKALIAKIARAKLMRIEMNVYQQGAIIAEFDVSGLDISKLK